MGPVIMENDLLMVLYVLTVLGSDSAPCST
jgi:hypothetical protein